MKKPAFSLVELLVSVMVISIIAVAFAPIVTKRMKGSFALLNNKKEEEQQQSVEKQELFTVDKHGCTKGASQTSCTFTIPEGVTSINVVAVGAGQGGGGATQGTVGTTQHMFLNPGQSYGNSFYNTNYSNFNLTIVSSGGGGGGAGAYGTNAYEGGSGASGLCSYDCQIPVVYPGTNKKLVYIGAQAGDWGQGGASYPSGGDLGLPTGDGTDGTQGGTSMLYAYYSATGGYGSDDQVNLHIILPGGKGGTAGKGTTLTAGRGGVNLGKNDSEYHSDFVCGTEAKYADGKDGVAAYILNPIDTGGGGVTGGDIGDSNCIGTAAMRGLGGKGGYYKSTNGNVNGVQTVNGAIDYENGKNGGFVHLTFNEITSGKGGYSGLAGNIFHLENFPVTPGETCEVKIGRGGKGGSVSANGTSGGFSGIICENGEYRHAVGGGMSSFNATSPMGCSGGETGPANTNSASPLVLQGGNTNLSALISQYGINVIKNTWADTSQPNSCPYFARNFGSPVTFSNGIKGGNGENYSTNDITLGGLNETEFSSNSSVNGTTANFVAPNLDDIKRGDYGHAGAGGGGGGWNKTNNTAGTGGDGQDGYVLLYWDE